jgi:hypothetical protein
MMTNFQASTSCTHFERFERENSTYNIIKKNAFKDSHQCRLVTGRVTLNKISKRVRLITWSSAKSHVASWICAIVIVSATAFAVARVVPLLHPRTQIQRPQRDGSIIRLVALLLPQQYRQLPLYSTHLNDDDKLPVNPVSGVLHRSGFPTNEEALNLVARAVRMRPCKLLSETLKV